MAKKEENDKFTGWDIKIAEWMGKTVNAIDNLNTDITKMDKKINDIYKNIDKINNSVINLRIKVAGIAGSISFIVTLLVLVIDKLL